MGIANQDAVKQLQLLMDEVEEPLKNSFENMHQGYVHETLTRFLKARDGNLPKAHKMLVDCLNWRIQNEIDNVLAKPILPPNLYRAVRDSQLIGLSGYTKEGLPVIAVGVGQSTLDKASVRILSLRSFGLFFKYYHGKHYKIISANELFSFLVQERIVYSK